MRILYALAGVGMGHATRSKVAIRHLERRGHEVLAAASNEAYRLLSRSRPDKTIPIEGITVRCVEGEFSLWATLEENVQRLGSILGWNASAWSRAEAFRPDVVVSDFEWFAWSFAKAHGLPLLSLDNHQILPRCVHDPAVLAECPDGYPALSRFTEAVAADSAHYIVTSFFFPPVRRELAPTTTLVPPILRDEVVAALRRVRESAPPLGEHVLVYKTSVLDDESFLDVLGSVPDVRFVAYGLSSSTAPPNVVRKPVSETGFIEDLASSRGVVGNGGMSFIGEAVAFGKPILAIPVRGQYEQILNARYVATCGYGDTAERLDAPVLRRFLERLGDYERTLRAAPRHDENRLLYATLDALLPADRVLQPQSSETPLLR